MDSEIWLRHCSGPGDRNLYDFGSSGVSIAKGAIKPVFLVDSCCYMADDGAYLGDNYDSGQKVDRHSSDSGRGGWMSWQKAPRVSALTIRLAL